MTAVSNRLSRVPGLPVAIAVSDQSWSRVVSASASITASYGIGGVTARMNSIGSVVWLR